MALLVVPLLLVGALELSLRLGGFGHPTAFILSREINGREFWINNDSFGWRFFPRAQARTPQPFAILRDKPKDTTRVFVFGESAAFGDPKPAFGVSRMLEVLLSHRHPERRFEVVNVAMTAINSHVIREIASDCSKADGDVWVIYMGNNEVVGPFGSGTVFGPQVPPLWAVRSSLALKASRTGQLLDVLRAKLNPPSADEREWGGMSMFLDHQVNMDDPRMERVYGHYERNLTDIIRTGRRGGADIVLCNVGVNLRNCAPFGSEFHPATTESQQAEWATYYELGNSLLERSDSRAAMAAFDAAAKVDDSSADLHFQKGRCWFSQTNTTMAARSLTRARDLDTLRFRFDSRMGEIVSRVALELTDDRVRFADVQAAFERHSPSGIPGREFFYEHVHLTWEGNYRLALTIAEQVDAFLRGQEAAPAGGPTAWASAAECARRLAWTDRSRLECIGEVLGRLQVPPFTRQLNHQEQLHHLQKVSAQAAVSIGTASLPVERAACEEAVEQSPNDPVLLDRLAALRLEMGDAAGAAEAAGRATELLPHAAPFWNRLGMILAQEGRREEALSALQTSLQLDPDELSAINNLAMIHLTLGHTNDALREWRRAISITPGFGTAYMGIGQVLETQGKIREADEYYRKAVQNRILRRNELSTLGQLCLRKRWYGDAVNILQEALQRAPNDPSLHLAIAEALKQLGRDEEANRHLGVAAQLNPQDLMTHFVLGRELGRQGKPAEAAKHFRVVVHLDPTLVEARINLGIALAKQGLTNEAIKEFNEVLRRNPTNATALQSISTLDPQPTAPQRPDESSAR